MRRSKILALAYKYAIGGLEFDQAGLFSFVKELQANLMEEIKQAPQQKPTWQDFAKKAGTVQPLINGMQGESSIGRVVDSFYSIEFQVPQTTEKP